MTSWPKRLCTFLVNKIIQLCKLNVSDGYHTFSELYAHRNALFIALCLSHKDKSWYSHRHSDGQEAFGHPWIIMGIGEKLGEQITYHINTDEFGYSYWLGGIKELDYAPLWDHHTANDVLFRLRLGKFLRGRGDSEDGK